MYHDAGIIGVVWRSVVSYMGYNPINWLCDFNVQYIPFVLFDMLCELHIIVGICIYWNYGRLHVIEDKNVINSSASLQSVRRAMDISKDKVIDNLKSLRRQDVATQPESKTLKTTDRFPLLPAGSGSHQNSYPAPASNYTQYLKVKLQADTTSLIR